MGDVFQQKHQLGCWYGVQMKTKSLGFFEMGSRLVEMDTSLVEMDTSLVEMGTSLVEMG